MDDTYCAKQAFFIITVNVKLSIKFAAIMEYTDFIGFRIFIMMEK